jgi:hypothetical protein
MKDERGGRSAIDFRDDVVNTVEDLIEGTGLVSGGAAGVAGGLPACGVLVVHVGRECVEAGDLFAEGLVGLVVRGYRGDAASRCEVVPARKVREVELLS